MIDSGELNDWSKVVWDGIRKEGDLEDLHHKVAWASQALIEFWDLTNFSHAMRGRFQYKNYLYFEAVMALREATVSMLNGTPRASVGLLRSVMEMLFLHCWWQKRILRKRSSTSFYDWLEGRKEQPKFNDVVNNNFDWLGIPFATTTKDHVNDIYHQLCSYVHAPIREESFTKISEGNIGPVGTGVLKRWFALAHDMLGIVLDQLVHLYPQSLFPVDVVKKFGFNPPVGMYFDKYNFVPLLAVFGNETITTYKGRLGDHDLVKTAMSFYESRPELSQQQIYQTWKEDGGVEGEIEEMDDLVVPWLCARAQMRAMSMLLTYSDPLVPHW